MGNVLKADNLKEVLWRNPGEVLDLGVQLRQALDLQRHVPRSERPVLSRREAVLLGLFALTLHGAVLYWLSQRSEPVLPEVPVVIPPMTIEFAAPPPPPEPVIEPPPPQPPKAETPPAPQPPKPAPAPVETPPSANAAYLKNPAPEYPSLAQRRGWEGTVLLRVHVQANGKPSEIQVQKSSGREALDEAAIRAVKRWSFVPAKRGDQTIAGWVTVPLDFRLN